MNKAKQKRQRRDKVRRRIRSSIRGTAERPRLCVKKSNKHIYAQLVNDYKANTLVTSSTVSNEMKDKLQDKGLKEAAKIIGQAIAEQAQEQGITKAVFDRSGYKYHGIVKALAEGAREGGLHF
jgi:large subunit ribosomal protein L18